ncbi:hypothetical protein [Emcibacter sp.]|uniref:hypothetical protein n=1 Tax=Emcibacter sp. TaxID=1979954 RepID=UPI002AA79FB3|nr:hypothetical protein [Emcibacter sp.]
MQHAIAQIKSLTLDSSKPVLVTDADEVLLDFADIFSRYLTSRDLYMSYESYALSGNIRQKKTDIPLPREEISPLLDDFFDYSVDQQELVPGVKANLDALSDHCQIVILTNLPHNFADRRRALFQRHDIHHPLVTNSGPKGPAVREISATMNQPLVFVDDISHHITSVAENVPESFRLQYVAHETLDRITEQAADSHHRCDDWDHIRELVMRHIGDLK